MDITKHKSDIWQALVCGSSPSFLNSKMMTTDHVTVAYGIANIGCEKDLKDQ